VGKKAKGKSWGSTETDSLKQLGERGRRFTSSKTAPQKKVAQSRNWEGFKFKQTALIEKEARGEV